MSKIVLMKTFEAKVVKGRLVLDEAIALPEGAVVRLVALDDDEVALDDEMDAEERAAFEQSLQRSSEDIEAGRVHPTCDVISELRARR